MYPVYYTGGAFSAAYVLMSILSFIFSHILLAIQLVGFWFTYKKMNLPGWKGLIPFYNVYTLFEELWEKKYFWRSLIFCAICVASFIVGEVLFAVGGVFTYRPYPDASLGVTGLALLIIGIVFFVAAIVMLILAFVIYYKIYHKTAKAFGLKKAWVWGMIFVPYIMFPIIGFNRNIVYYGPVEHLEPVEEVQS